MFWSIRVSSQCTFFSRTASSALVLLHVLHEFEKKKVFLLGAVAAELGVQKMLTTSLCVFVAPPLSGTHSNLDEENSCVHEVLHGFAAQVSVL